MAVDPAGDFAALLHARLAHRPPLAEPDAQAILPAPRLPAVNRAQGSSGIADPPRPSPADAFASLFAELGVPRGDGGWRAVR